MIGPLGRLVGEFVEMLVCHWPGSGGVALRRRYWKSRLRFMGAGVRIDPGVYFQNPGRIVVDDGCWIDRGTILLAGPDPSARPRRRRDIPEYRGERGELRIGKRVHVGPRVLISGIGGVDIGDDCGIGADTKIYSFSHRHASADAPADRSFVFSPLVAAERQFMVEGPVVLAGEVGVALNATLLPGTYCGPQSFVGAGSVVSGRFPENSMIAGAPAKRIGDRFAASAGQSAVGSEQREGTPCIRDGSAC